MSFIVNLRNKQIKLVPFLHLPVSLSDHAHNWYCIQKKDIKLILKYLYHFAGNVVLLFLLPLSLIIDVLLGTLAVIAIPFSKTHRVALKQIAWDCLICGLFGPLTVIFQISKRMLLPKNN